MDRKANDRRVRQAIQYLEREREYGTPAALYAHKVQSIDKGIVKKYGERGYHCDRNMYRRLRSLVEEAQSHSTSAVKATTLHAGNRYLAPEEPPFSPMTPDGGFSSASDISSNSISRDGETYVFSRNRQARNVDPEKKQYLYGGPVNESEYRLDVPPTFTFGENLYMKTWEGMKIDHDMKESAKLINDPDPSIWANVPYDAVRGNFDQEDTYDSGSRFKLPAVSEGVWGRIKRAATDVVFNRLAKDFNDGGGHDHQMRRDFVPRIFLPPVNTSVRRGSVSSDDGIEKSTVAEDKDPIRRNVFPSTVAGPSRPRNPAASSKTGTINPAVLTQIRKHLNRPSTEANTAAKINNQPSTYSAPRPKSRPISKAPRSRLKKFDERRAIASRRSVTPDLTGAAARTGRSPSHNLVAKEPKYLDPARVAAAPIVEHRSERASKATSEVNPTLRVATARPSAGKRKLDAVVDSAAGRSKKAKVADKTPAKISAKKSVTFKNTKATSTAKPAAKSAVAKKTTIPTAKPGAKSATVKKPRLTSPKVKVPAKTTGVKKPTPKKKASTTAVSTSSALPKGEAAGSKVVKWGTTRSGYKFKEKS